MFLDPNYDKIFEYNSSKKLLKQKKSKSRFRKKRSTISQFDKGMKLMLKNIDAPSMLEQLDPNYDTVSEGFSSK